MGRDLPLGIDSLLLFGPTLVAKAIDPPLFFCYINGLLLVVGPAGHKAALLANGFPENDRSGTNLPSHLDLLAGITLGHHGE
jgi:hypothetical protein